MKKLLTLLALVLLAAAPIHAVDKKISELPAATTVNDSDTGLLVQGGITKRATIALLRGTAITWSNLSGKPEIFPTASANITDATAAGLALLTAGNATLQRTSLGLGASDNATFAGLNLTGDLTASLFEIRYGNPSVWPYDGVYFRPTGSYEKLFLECGWQAGVWIRDTSHTISVMSNLGVRFHRSVKLDYDSWGRVCDLYTTGKIGVGTTSPTETLSVTNGTSAADLAVYGTMTDDSNFRRLRIGSTTGGEFSIMPEGAGTGASGNLLNVGGMKLNPANGDSYITVQRYDVGNPQAVHVIIKPTTIYGQLFLECGWQQGVHITDAGATIASFGNLGVYFQRSLDIASDTIRLRTAKTPASATATGNAGDICWDADYVYICVATNTWKRAALSTW